MIQAIFAEVFDVAPNPPGSEQHSDNSDNEVEAMKPGLERVVLVPLLAEFLPDVGQAEAPGERTGECIDDESFQIHSGHAGWKRNKRADGGQQSTNKDNNLTVVGKPPVCQIEIMRRDEDVTPVLLNQRATTFAANPIRHERAKHATDGAGDAHEPQIHLTGRNQVTGKRHDDLRRQRYAGRFNRHQQDDSGVAQQRNSSNDDA